jgi:arylsulfatase A-like enzyme
MSSLLTVTAGAHTKGVPDRNKAPKPNILYIMSDDHSYNAISAYGSDVSRLAPTPNIDRIANNGMIFERAFVENSLSTPSRACVMTGSI